MQKTCPEKFWCGITYNRLHQKVFRDGRVKMIVLHGSVLEISCISKVNRSLKCIHIWYNFLFFCNHCLHPHRSVLRLHLQPFFILKIYTSHSVLKTTTQKHIFKNMKVCTMEPLNSIHLNWSYHTDHLWDFFWHLLVNHKTSQFYQSFNVFKQNYLR